LIDFKDSLNVLGAQQVAPLRILHFRLRTGTTGAKGYDVC
jgi:hypothetical protein